MSKWYPKNGRVIFHVDMNSFYASVEMAFDPKLKGKPLAIAGNPEERRGIVVTSSYEARKFGVKTTMPVGEARRLCPELMVMRPNFERYRTASKEMFKILADVTSLVQPVSIDEGYMDITNCSSQGSPPEIAERIQQRIADELDLPCSIGIAPNKFLAKMASDMKKPMGITILRKRDLQNKLWPLPIEEMYGVGDKTAEKLRRIKVETIGDLAVHPVLELKRLLGINGERLQNRANGYDQRPVDPDAVHEFKSIGTSTTLPEDTTDDQEVRSVLRKLTHKVEARMKNKKVLAQNVQLMIRYHDRKTVTRSRQLKEFIQSAEDLFQVSLQLFDEHWNQEPIRLLGITAQDLAEKSEITQQLDLFNYEQYASKEKLYKAIDDLTEKYGSNPFQPLSAPQNNTVTTSFQKDFLDDFKK
ncbi:DNA polymerase IV [Halobacillus halophilus]|uniref:DNA polymerase IV n=1 Tax=Halobacillus halophilus (strain ATCC 35676 / DSM 2266 / JCM 20832 / KCTC 3685 / LMG 17431 / NBRC 102448 / NCIMB 2269) TaxID=866895 RepID=I0JNR7_HALH3|nr:DNA polymerase IV [Halobacillus halophilus]ASF39833.1 DNA polymerase IV [Halobacillus halophilus]CCG45787.1 DNA polymerase IV [Halobacillus halophilus DSM 2266]